MNVQLFRVLTLLDFILDHMKTWQIIAISFAFWNVCDLRFPNTNIQIRSNFRGVFDRQDSLRSDYLSDRETRYGIVQQASIDSTDSRLCYLTSSEVKQHEQHINFVKV